MTIIAIGLNHRSAPIDLVGRMAIPDDLVGKALVEFTNSSCINEAAVLSTCNRTEVYVDAERFHDAYAHVRNGLAVVTGVDPDQFVPHLAVKYHLDATEQLFRVAAGLDSAVLGEHEILGQVRSAADRAAAEGTSGTVLRSLFVHAVQCGKRVRTETAIGRHTASLSHAALTLIGEHLGQLDQRRVLLIGTGDVGAGIATALTKSAEIDLTIANRTRSRAEGLAADVAGPESTPTVIDLTEIVDAIDGADVIISGTAAPGPIITASMVTDATLSDRGRVFLDLALPADVEPEAADQLDAELLTLADLQAVANRGIEQRQAEAIKAAAIVSDMIERYEQSVSADQVEPLLGSLHRWGNDVRAEQLERYRSRLADLEPAELDAVEALTKSMVAKLLHPVSRELRGASGSPRGDRLAESTRELFDLT